MLAGIGVLIYGCFQPNSLYLVTLGIGIFFICYLVWYMLEHKAQKLLTAEMEKWARYDPTQKTLNVYRRGEELRKLLRVESVKYYNTHVTPTKVHVGSATVGGVTTGGVYTTGGQTVFDKSTDSGKGKIIYTNAVIKDGRTPLIEEELSYIQLAPDLTEKARKDNIWGVSESGSVLLKREHQPLSLDQLKYAMENVTTHVAQAMLQDEYRSIDDCKKIAEWLFRAE